MAKPARIFTLTLVLCIVASPWLLDAEESFKMTDTLVCTIAASTQPAEVGKKITLRGLTTAAPQAVYENQVRAAMLKLFESDKALVIQLVAAVSGSVDTIVIDTISGRFAHTAAGVFFEVHAIAETGTCVAAAFQAAEDVSDAQEYTFPATADTEGFESYGQALNTWKTPEDLNAWIGSNFSYDTHRAIRLSETQSAQQGPSAIYTPSHLFAVKSGMCVDLARFAVETMRNIDPLSDSKYLMIEFAPIYIDGNLLRRHWLATFKRDGQIFFFADSKRPGLMAGPYKKTEDFIKEYERYRGRTIENFRELESYRRELRMRPLKKSVQRDPRD
jgi:hypothetical protein